MKVRSYGQSDIGLQREGNEDFFLRDDELGLYIVCDGVGGHAAGEVAARCAAAAAHRHVLAHREALQREEEGSLDLLQLADDAVQAACAEVNSLSKTKRECAGMATTLTMLLLLGEKAVMAHVGDSRLYLKRRNRVHQLSTDHTLVNDLWQQGLMTREQMENSPYANVLTRSIGSEPKVLADTLLFDVLPDDVFLLSTDGFTKALKNKEELETLLDDNDLAKLPEKMINFANQRGGSDNSTVLIVSPLQSDDRLPKQDQQRSDEVMRRIDTLRQMYVFQDLTLSELLTVMDITSVCSCNGGQVLIKEGEQTDRFYIILEGSVEIYKGDKMLATLGKGSHFGEMALLNEGPRSATVRAVEDGRMLVLEREPFTRLIRQKSQIGVKLMQKFASELSYRLERANLQLYRHA